jgi:hypothetical protein
MGLARLRTADAGRKTRRLGNASFRSAAIRLWRATLVVGNVSYNCTEVSIWFGAAKCTWVQQGKDGSDCASAPGKNEGRLLEA